MLADHGADGRVPRIDARGDGAAVRGRRPTRHRAPLPGGALLALLFATLGGHAAAFAPPAIGLKRAALARRPAPVGPGAPATAPHPSTRRLAPHRAVFDSIGFSDLPVDDVAMAANTALLNVLGSDALVFLAATVAIVPLCKRANISPVLGFLGAGFVLGPNVLGALRGLQELDLFGELGILFLLFEQGLELTLQRLRALAKYVGLGAIALVGCTVAFGVFPFVGGTEILETVFQSPPDLVSITRPDEALVIGAALSLSSSAFVLKILQEKGQMTAKVGAASLGILLLQDIAVVPLLVLLPIIEFQQSSTVESLSFKELFDEGAKAALALGVISLSGELGLRPLFNLVAAARSSETFVALCLLVALGAGQLTSDLGFSATLGAFLAGALLAETNYKTMIESDLKPFRGLLLGLFFMTTGASVDVSLLIQEWPTALGLLGGLLTFKTVIIAGLAVPYKLTYGESAKLGLLLAGGSEFAFVVLTLAEQLGILPSELAKLLSAIVVISMALTPALSAFGDSLAVWIDARVLPGSGGLVPAVAGAGAGAGGGDPTAAARLTKFLQGPSNTGGLLTAQDPNAPPVAEKAPPEPVPDGLETPLSKTPVVICGFGPIGQTVATMLSQEQKLEREAAGDGDGDGDGDEGDVIAPPYVAFDLNPDRVAESRRRGCAVFYGDGTQARVREAVGVEFAPQAFVVCYSDYDERLASVERVRREFPTVPIVSRAQGIRQLSGIREAGADFVVPEVGEVAVRVGCDVLQSLNVANTTVRSVATTQRAELIRLADAYNAESAAMPKRGGDGDDAFMLGFVYSPRPGLADDSENFARGDAEDGADVDAEGAVRQRSEALYKDEVWVDDQGRRGGDDGSFGGPFDPKGARQMSPTPIMRVADLLKGDDTDDR